MQLMNKVKPITASLARMYLGVVIGLASWAILPLILGWTPTVVMSGSMLPNIEVGDVLVAQNLNDEQKRKIIPGQVLLATDPSHPDRLVTHRVVNVIEGSGFITKGDANPEADPTLVPIANVHGIERLLIPMIGTPVQSMRSGDAGPLMLFIILTAIAQLLVMNENKIKKAIKQTAKSPSLQKPQKEKKARKKGFLRHKTSSVLAYSLVIFLSVVTASSAASFSGNSINSSNVFAAKGSFSLIPYMNTVIADDPFAYYRLNDKSGNSDTEDLARNPKKTRFSSTGITYGTPGALKSDAANKAITLDGISGSIASNGTISGPRNVTLEIWFKSNTKAGGMLAGFNAVGGGIGANRVLYMTSSGKVNFGIDRNSKKTIESIASYNDGNWHMATATLSGANAALYIDGKLVSSGTTTSAPTTSNGNWIIGGGEFSGWLNQPSSKYFAGSIDEVGIYTKTLTAAQILSHYNAS